MDKYFLKKLKRSYVSGRLWPSLGAYVMPWLKGSKSFMCNSARSVRIHCPDYIQANCDDFALMERIFTSFRAMKRAQQKQDQCYMPATMWQESLDSAYAPLVSALTDGNMEPVFHFFANFGAWREYLGIDHAPFIQKCIRNPITYAYLKNDVFYRQLRIWKWFYNDRKPLAALTYPTFGNQTGAYVDGHFIGIGSFFNEVYGDILSGLVADVNRPVIADLGGGYGRLAHFILRHLDTATFIDFDLPETLCLAAYFLMKSYPGKSVLLYGENEYSVNCHKNYDMIFMPSFEIRKVGKESVDLFINKNSLGEMTKESVYAYITAITSATRYFFHLNHDGYRNMYRDDSSGLLGYEYSVPMEQFKLLFRYPDIGHLLYKGGMDFREDAFWYLYERKKSKAI